MAKRFKVTCTSCNTEYYFSRDTGEHCPYCWSTYRVYPADPQDREYEETDTEEDE